MYFHGGINTQQSFHRSTMETSAKHWHLHLTLSGVLLRYFHWQIYTFTDLPQQHGISSAKLDFADDLSLGLVRLHEFVCLLNIIPVKHFLNKYLESSVLEIREVLLQLVSKLALVLGVPAAKAATLVSNTLADECTDIDTRWKFSS